jgi:hypothetical protein
MVTRRFTQGLSWLHARVGRRIAIEGSRESNGRNPNSHARENAAVILRPTVYLASGRDPKLTLIEPAA